MKKTKETESQQVSAPRDLRGKKLTFSLYRWGNWGPENAINQVCHTLNGGTDGSSVFSPLCLYINKTGDGAFGVYNLNVCNFEKKKLKKSIRWSRFDTPT